MIKGFTDFQNKLWEAAIDMGGAEGTEACQQTAIKLQELIKRAFETDILKGPSSNSTLGEAEIRMTHNDSPYRTEEK